MKLKVMLSAVVVCVVVLGGCASTDGNKNYREFDGMLFPMELTQLTPQAALKITFSEIAFAPVTDDKFAKPD